MPIIRRLAQMVVLALIAALTLWTWGPAVGTRTIRVYGSSMAPTLLGEHGAWVCSDCQFPFATGADMPPSAEFPAVCPNCGLQQPPEARPTGKPGDRLQIETLSARKRPPQRFDTVVFRTPESLQHHGAQPHSIKRVVGLPGETVELRGGDVWIDGRRVRKTLPQQRTLAMTVYDSRYPPRESEKTPPRWAPAQESSVWRAGDDGSFRFTEGERRASALRLNDRNQQGAGTVRRGGWSAPRSPAPCDWLQYTHWSRSPSDPAQFERAEITDDYAYNRGESRRLNRVDDLLLTARVRATGSGHLCFGGNIDGQTYAAQLMIPDGQVRFLRGDQPIPDSELHAATLPPETFAQEFLAEFSLVDHQVLLAIDGRLVLAYVLPDEASTAAATLHSFPPQALAIGAADLSLEVLSLRVLRDIYYIPPRQPGAVTLGAVTLGPDAFYVLGDNSPLSADSRTGWPGPGVDRRYLFGVLQAP